MIGTNGERESGKSELAVRHDDDNDDIYETTSVSRQNLLSLSLYLVL